MRALNLGLVFSELSPVLPTIQVAKAKGVLEGSELLVESNQQVSRGITSLLAGIKAITDTP
jgi:hypothetical protein